jgi:hypothetical protein
MRFPKRNQPTVRPQADYSPTRSAVKPPGFAEIDAVSLCAADSEAWEPFVRDVAQMPAAMTPAIQEAVRQAQWRIAPNPMATVRKLAYQEAKRMGLR